MSSVSLAKVVVAGGSIAGVTAAQHLRLHGFDGEIVLLSDEPHPPYSRVPLSKSVLSGKEPASSCALPHLGDDITLRLSNRVTGVDLVRELVLTDGEHLSYDGLVIATGARARSLAVPGQGGEHLVRTLDQATDLLARLERADSVVVVGAGFLGMEVASTCLDRGLQVTVVDREPPLRRLLGRWLADLVVAEAQARGVRFVLAPDGVSLVGTPNVSAVDCGGAVVTADVVVSAVGDVPNTEWLTGSDVRLDKGAVVVDTRCRVVPYDNVVAAGDATIGQHGRTPHWMSAVRQAQTAAVALLHGDGAAPLHADPYFWTEQFGLEIKISGLIPPTAAPQVLAGDPVHHSALLQWHENGTPVAAVALNHAIPVGKLKRLATEVLPPLDQRVQASNP